jgi:hypothetical protein
MDESEAAWLNKVNNAALNNTGGRSIGDPLNEGPLADQLQNIKTMSRVYDLLPESMHTINALIYQKGEGRKWAEEYGISPAGFANQADRDSFTFANGYGENSYSKEVFIHEFAHTLDFARDLASYSPKYRPNWLLESDEAFLNDLAADRHGKSSAWKAARQEDALNLMNLGLAEKYSFESGDVSHYGMKNEYEDFAESFTHYILDKIDGYYRTVDDKAYSFADMFPGRAKYFDTWIEWAKSVKPANVDDFENSHVTPQPMHTHPHE